MVRAIVEVSSVEHVLVAPGIGLYIRNVRAAESGFRKGIARGNACVITVDPALKSCCRRGGAQSPARRVCWLVTGSGEDNVRVVADRVRVAASAVDRISACVSLVEFDRIRNRSEIRLGTGNPCL